MRLAFLVRYLESAELRHGEEEHVQKKLSPESTYYLARHVGPAAAPLPAFRIRCMRRFLGLRPAPLFGSVRSGQGRKYGIQ